MVTVTLPWSRRVAQSCDWEDMWKVVPSPMMTRRGCSDHTMASSRTRLPPSSMKRANWFW